MEKTKKQTYNEYCNGEKTRKVVRFGNSAGILLDKFMLYDSGIFVGDILEYKCTKHKIVFKKKQDKVGE